MMNVVIVNRSDTQGGAAIVSLRLLHALKRAGVDARMLVIDRQDIDPYVHTAGNALLNRWHFLAERLGIFARCGFSRENLFKIDTLSHGINIARHPWVQNADIVALNWVNQGMLSFRSVRQLHRAGKRLVWTMHDMWNCTGVCHHSFDCERYKDTCRACPLLKGDGDDLSTKIQRKKAKLYAAVPICFVAVSRWLEERCRESALLRDADVRMIHNAFPIDQFDYSRLNDDTYNIPAGKKVVVMGARRLDEAVKGFDQFIATTQYIARERPQLGERLHFMLYGDLRDMSLLEQIPLSTDYIGEISSTTALNDLYRHADVVLSTSLYETLPGTLIEGQASGCLPVTFGKGGQLDIVDHQASGYIADYLSPASVADGLAWAIDANVEREWLHNEVERKFSADTIAQQYISLFEDLLCKQ